MLQSNDIPLPGILYSLLNQKLFGFGCKTISRQAARRLIVLRSKQNIESELK